MPLEWVGNTKSVVPDALPIAAHCWFAKKVAVMAQSNRPHARTSRLDVIRGRCGTIKALTMGKIVKSPHIPAWFTKPSVTWPEANVPSRHEMYAAPAMYRALIPHATRLNCNETFEVRVCQPFPSALAALLGYPPFHLVSLAMLDRAAPARLR